jgi:hypothetical protein
MYAQRTNLAFLFVSNFLYIFCSKYVSLRYTSASYARGWAQKPTCAFLQLPSLLSDFNQNYDVSTNFCKNQTSWKNHSAVVGVLRANSGHHEANRSTSATPRLIYWRGFTAMSVVRLCSDESQVFLSQLVNTATSSPADDVHHYAIPPKLLLTNRFYFRPTSVFIRQWEKEKAALYPVEVLNFSVSSL